MNRQVLLAIVLGTFLIFLMGSVSNVSALTYIDSCQSLSTYGETYVLNDTISDTGEDNNCLVIQNGSITLDCAGYTVITNESFSGVHSDGAIDLTVKNCYFEGWENPLYLQSMETLFVANISAEGEIYCTSCSNVYYYNVSSSDSTGHGIHFFFGENATLDLINIYNTADNGMLIYYYDNLTMTNVDINKTSGTFAGMEFDGDVTSIFADNVEISDAYYGLQVGSDMNGGIFDHFYIENSGDDGINVASSANISITNSNITNSGDYGVYMSSCNYCNITNSYFNDNVDDGIYVSSSTNAYLYNLTTNRNDYGLYLINSHNSIIDSIIVDSNMGSGGLRIQSENITITNLDVINTTGSVSSVGITIRSDNINISNSSLKGNGVDLTMSSGVDCSTLTLSNITVTGDKPLLFYKTTTVVQNTDNVGYLIFCEANDSVVNNVNMTSNYVDILSSDNVTISNFYCNGCHRGIDANDNTVTITDSVFNGTTYISDISSNGNLTMTNVTITNSFSPSMGIFLVGESVIRNLNIDCANCGATAIEIDGGTHIIYDSVILGSHAGISIDKTSNLVNLDVYNTNISFINNSLDPVFGVNNNSISIYCGYYNPPTYNCDATTNTNFYNTTFSSYMVNWTGSSLNRYWNLNISNPLQANSTVYNVTGDEIQNFNDSRSLLLREYYVIANNVRTNSTPHIINWTRSGYEDNSTSVEMDASKSVTLQMATPSTPPIYDQLPSFIQNVVILLGFGIIGLFSILFLYLAVLPTMKGDPENIIKVVIASVVIMLVLVAVYLGMIT